MSELAFLISSLSLYNKEQEFRAWLVEERKINPETTSKEQTKKEFARFVEDYNTGTFVVHQHGRLVSKTNQPTIATAGSPSTSCLLSACRA